MGIAAAAACLAAAHAVAPADAARMAPFERPGLVEYAAQDTAFVLAGARRLGADLAFIQLLQYYGDGENARPTPGQHRRHTVEHQSGDGHFHSLGAENFISSTSTALGDFPYLKDYALRIGRIDPNFTYAYLFAGGALGFNLKRHDEALDVLADGSRRNPDFWRFRLYVAAIGYKNTNFEDKAIPYLEEAVADPEAPSMLRYILANIHRRRGDNKRAAELYIDLLEHSRDREYVNNARRHLQEMGLLPRG